MDELKKKLITKKSKPSSAEMLQMAEALLRSQENTNEVAPFLNETPVRNESTAISADFIPNNAYQPSDWNQKVILPSAMETFGSADVLEEASDLGLQQLIMDRDEPYVINPTIIDPSYKGDDFGKDDYGIIRKKRLLDAMRPKIKS